MWIKTFRVENFMSFQDSGQHELSPHMNIVVGKNNAGKTALLRAISMRLLNLPHRNSSFPRGHVYNPESSVDMQFVVSGEEIRSMLLSRDHVQIPVPDAWRGVDQNVLLD